MPVTCQSSILCTTHSFICTSLPLLPVLLTVGLLYVVFPPHLLYLSFNVSLTLCCCFFPFFHSSHPLFITFFSSSLFLGSLLTLLNVRAQTSPCRAAPSRRGQKQLVSFPYPCFLAASVCLVWLFACQCPVIPSVPHLLSDTGWWLVIQTFI